MVGSVYGNGYVKCKFTCLISGRLHGSNEAV